MGKATGAGRLLVVGVIVVAGLGLTAAPAAAAPGLTVTPATGLLDQQIVTITGSGFARGEWLIVAQCPGATLAGCNLDPPVNTSAIYASADWDGTFSTSLRLSRYLGGTSCARSECAIVAVPVRGWPRIERGRAAIAFAATGSAVTPDATLAITGELRANGSATATWSGSGYLPWFETLQYDVGFPLPLNVLDYLGAGPGAYVAVCRPSASGRAGCERLRRPRELLDPPNGFAWPLESVWVERDGTVSRQRGLPRMWATADGRLDCAVEDCAFALEQDGAPHSNVVDVAWAPEWVPWPSARAFVVEAYVALVGRVPTSSERATAIAGLTDRSLTGFALLRQLAGRADGLRLAELTRLYQAALDRRPDVGGLLYWASELRRTGSISSIAVAFGRTPEFRRAFGPSANDFVAVNRAYERTLDRAPSAAEYGYWVGRLEAGLARTHMIHLFSRTPEFVARELGLSEVAAVTAGLLHRMPTGAEWAPADPYETRTLSQRIDDAVLEVLSSDELIAAVG